MADYVDIQDLSPDEQLAEFARTPFLRNVLFSSIVHIALIAITSVAFITTLGQDEDKAAVDGENPTEQAANADANDSGDDKAVATGDDADAADGSQTSDAEGNAETDKREPSDWEKEHHKTADPDELDVDSSGSSMLEDMGL